MGYNMLTFSTKLLRALLLDGTLLVLTLCASPNYAWVSGKTFTDPLLQPSVMRTTTSINTQPYSDLIDLTDALGPKVAAFNKGCQSDDGLKLLAKTEFLNPASQSHKDRIAKAIITKGEERGELTDSHGNKKAILAASSGNTGHALSRIASDMGYKVIIITDKKCSQEKCDNIRNAGGVLWLAEDLPLQFPDDLSDPKLNYMDQERILCANYPDKYYSVNQYDNFDNMMAHYEETAQEIWDQSQHRVTHFVMAASTGGSIMGVGKFLKEKTDGKVRVILSDPHKSHLASIFEKSRGNLAKGEELLRKVKEAINHDGIGIQVEGAGKGALTEIMKHGGGVLNNVDEVVPIHDFDAFDMCNQIHRERGMMIGGSAGMNVKTCQHIAERLIDEGNANGAVLTTMLCDDGMKYYSKIFNPEWIAANDNRPKKVSSQVESVLNVNGGMTLKSPKVGHRIDPTNWNDYGSQMRGLVDSCVDKMRTYRESPWQKPPSNFQKDLEIESDGADAGTGVPLPAVIDELVNKIMPLSTGNTHPQFMGWVHGAGMVSCVAADLVSSTMNSNCGGRHQGAAYVEVACINWLCAKAGYPIDVTSSTSTKQAIEPFGVLTGGTSQATIYALMAARTKKFGYEIRKKGIQSMSPVKVYVSEAAHSCVSRAMECIGHGSDNVVRIPIDDGGSMRIDLLRKRLEEDKAAGFAPLAIVGTAGSVTVGAYDDFQALSKVAKENETWLHVDAAFGFWTRLSQDLKISSFTDNINQADSIALDAHKWPGVQYDCGALLVKNKEHLRSTLASRPAYLQSASEGLAGGDTWFTDYSLDLSRGFRALKLWTALKVSGSDNIGAVITDHCDLAAYMGELVDASPLFELAHPVISNICCFCVNPSITTKDGDLVADVADIAADLQLQGKGVFSTVNLGDKQCLRAAIVNHRATHEDIAKAVAAAEESLRKQMEVQDHQENGLGLHTGIPRTAGKY